MPVLRPVRAVMAPAIPGGMSAPCTASGSEYGEDGEHDVLGARMVRGVVSRLKCPAEYGVHIAAALRWRRFALKLGH